MTTRNRRLSRDLKTLSCGRSLLFENEIMEKALEASNKSRVKTDTSALPAKITSIRFSDGSQFVREGEKSETVCNARCNPLKASSSESVPRQRTPAAERNPTRRNPTTNPTRPSTGEISSSCLQYLAFFDISFPNLRHLPDICSILAKHTDP